MAETLELHRKIATLEAELSCEKAQHAIAQQSLVYLARQLSINDQYQRPISGLSKDKHVRTGRKKAVTSDRSGNQSSDVEDLLDSGRSSCSLPSSPVTPPTPLFNYSSEAKHVSRVKGKGSEHQTQPIGLGISQGGLRDDTAILDDRVEGQLSVEPPRFDTGDLQAQLLRISALLHTDNAVPGFIDFRHGGLDDSRDARIDGSIHADLNDSMHAGEKACNDQAELIQLSDVVDQKAYTLTQDDPRPTVAADVQQPQKVIAGDAKAAAVEQDLLEFPENCEEADTAPNTIPSSIEISLAAEKARLEEMKETQAMLMHKPEPEDGNIFCTVMVTEIPSENSVADIMALVRGGVIVSIKPMHTSSITGSESIMITFFLAIAAKEFVESMNHSQAPKFTLLETPTWPLTGDIVDSIARLKHTRCLAIHRLEPDIALRAIKNVLCEAGTMWSGVISAGRDDLGTVHLEFCSVVAAKRAVERTRRHPWFRIANVEFEADPCDCAILGLVEEEEHEDGRREGEQSEEKQQRDASEDDTDDKTDEEVVKMAVKKEEGEAETLAGAEELDY